MGLNWYGVISSAVYRKIDSFVVFLQMNTHILNRFHGNTILKSIIVGKMQTI